MRCYGKCDPEASTKGEAAPTVAANGRGRFRVWGTMPKANSFLVGAATALGFVLVCLKLWGCG